MKQENILFILLVLISTLGQVSSDLYLPSLPAIAENLGASFKAVKLTITAFMIGFAIAPLIYGPLSDGIGRHKPLLFGLSLCLLGTIICFSAQSIEILLIGRLCQGLGAGAGSSLFRSILRDLWSGAKLAKYGSYSALVGILGLAFAPLLGGYFQHYFGWRSNFIFLAVITFMALLCVIFIVPETNRYLHKDHLTAKKIKNNFFTLVSSPVFMSYSSINFLTYGAILAWLTSGPILLQKVLLLSPVDFGWIYAIVGIAFALGALLNSLFVVRFGTEFMLQFGMFCMLIAGCLLLGFKLLGYINVFVIVLPVMLLLFSVPIVFNNSFAGAFHPFPQIAGMVGALFGTMTTLGGAVTSSLLAFAPDKNQLPMAIVIVGCAVLSWGIYYFGIKRCGHKS